MASVLFLPWGNTFWFTDSSVNWHNEIQDFTYVPDFCHRLLSQHCKVNHLSNTFKKFYGRYNDLVGKYKKHVCQMFADCISENALFGFVKAELIKLAKMAGVMHAGRSCLLYPHDMVITLISYRIIAFVINLLSIFVQNLDLLNFHLELGLSYFLFLSVCLLLVHL